MAPPRGHKRPAKHHLFLRYKLAAFSLEHSKISNQRASSPRNRWRFAVAAQQAFKQACNSKRLQQPKREPPWYDAISFRVSSETDQTSNAFFHICSCLVWASLLVVVAVAVYKSSCSSRRASYNRRRRPEDKENWPISLSVLWARRDARSVNN